MSDKFEKQLDRLLGIAFVGLVTTWIIGLGLLGAVGYVVYKILIHFGIL